MGQLDLATVVVALAGLCAGVALAILAGRVSARVILDASRRRRDEL